jgi:DedD protein
MARSISEQELQLKKRARRRLVGAIVLVTAVAVVLPMVLDSEPKPVRQNVDIHIPSPDTGEFKPKTSEPTQQALAPIKGLPESPSGAPPADAAASGPASAPSAQTSAGAGAPVANPPRAETPASRLSDLPDRTTGTPGKDRADAARPPTSAPKPEASAQQRAASGDRPDSARSASGASKSKPEASVRGDRSDGARSASSAPASKPEASAARTGSDRGESARGTAAAAKRPADANADSGGYVVQVAALADAAKARQLQKQMSGAGLKTYTEVISTKAGEVTRVRAGPYATRDAAEKARAQLKKAGLDGQVVAK